MGKNFIKETKAELKKVIWPSKQDVINGTGVVIVMVAIVGVIILGFDFLSSTAVKEIMQLNPSSNEIIIEESKEIPENNEEGTETDNTNVIPDGNTEVTDNNSAE